MRGTVYAEKTIVAPGSGETERERDRMADTHETRVSFRVNEKCGSRRLFERNGRIYRPGRSYLLTDYAVTTALG